MTAVLSSIESFHNLSHKHDQKQRVLDYMHAGKIYTRRQLASAIGMETSTMSARCNELLKDGSIVKSGRVECPETGVNVEGLKLVSKQLELM